MHPNPIMIRSWLGSIVVCLSLALSALAQSPQEPSDPQWVAKAEAERMLPSDAMVYAQLAPADLWWNHPLRDRIAESEPFQKIWNSRDVLNARTGLVAGEWAMGMKLETLFKRLTVGGVYAAIDADAKGFVVLARSQDSKWLQQTLTKFIALGRNDESQPTEKPGAGRLIDSAVYRGIQGYKWNNLVFAPLGPWLMLTNRSELAEGTLDRHLDGSNATLTDATWRVSPTYSPSSRQANETRDPDRLKVATVEIDLQKTRDRMSDNDLFRKQAKDFGAELLLGGVLAVLQHAPSAAMELSLEPDAVSTEASFPTEMEWFSESREHYVGPNGAGRSLPLLEMPGTLASLSTYRNLSELWLRAGDLFDQQVNDQLAQADNTLTTLFSGRDFGSEILGAIEPELRIVAIHQAWKPDVLQPSLKLPAFAMIARLKEPQAMRRELKRIFQSFVGFLNIVGAMEGQPQLDLMSDERDSGPVYWAEYVIDSDRKYENGLPIQYNFKPSIAFMDDQVILSSDVLLVRQIMSSGAWHETGESPEAPPTNTELTVYANTVLQALAANRDNLIAQNMLEKGNSRSQAVREIEQLLGFLELIDRFHMELQFDARTSLRLRVGYR